MGTLKVGSVMFVQVERATGLSVEPDVSATVTVPMELVDSDEAEVLEW